MTFRTTAAAIMITFTLCAPPQVTATDPPPVSYEVVCPYPLTTCSVVPDGVGDITPSQILEVPEEINILRNNIGTILMDSTSIGCPSPDWSALLENTIGPVVPDLSKYCPGPSRLPACADERDNDGDGRIDYPEDPGCASATDSSESDSAPAPAAACADGLDNDADGRIDYPNDPGCSSSSDADETDPANSTCTNTKGALIGMAWSGSQSFNDTVTANTTYRTWETKASILGLTRTTYLDSAGQPCGQSYLAQRLVLRGSTSPNSEFRDSNGLPAPVAALHHGSNETCELGVGIQSTVHVATDSSTAAPPTAKGARSYHYLLIDNAYYGPGIVEKGDTTGGVDFRQDDVDVPPVTSCAASTPPPQGGDFSFSASSYSRLESGVSVTITVRRAGSASGTSSVQYQTDAGTGTATAGTDYVATSGTLTWTDGETGNKTFAVSIVSDTRDEPDESFRVSLSNPVNATLGTPATANVTIIDDDDATTPPRDDCLQAAPTLVEGALPLDARQYCP